MASVEVIKSTATADLEMMKSDAKVDIRATSRRIKPQNLHWTHVQFTVKGKKILSDCWGEVPAGKVCAIMGPSGAGKVFINFIFYAVYVSLTFVIYFESVIPSERPSWKISICSWNIYYW